MINRDVVVMLDNECMWQAMGNVWKVWREVLNKNTLPATLHV
ncbi:hypothetical protein [Bacteroides acidifaciens]